MNRQPEASAYDPALFAGTASYYARYRSPYPAEVFDFLCGEFRLGADSPVLDLGCGTGQLAVPLACAGCRVKAVDPDPEMLAEGARTQPATTRDRIEWISGRAEDLGRLGMHGLRLCTMGASFHWMDRDLVLQLLDDVVAPDGGVALVAGSASIWSRSDSLQGAWLDVAREVITEFLGPRRRAGSGTYSHPKRRHEEVLRDSSFHELQERTFESRRRLSVDEVIGQQLSTSYASPRQLGDKLPAFRAELSRRLTRIAPSDGFSTTERITVVVARRGPEKGGGR